MAVKSVDAPQQQDNATKNIWHTYTTEALLKHYNVDPAQGLSDTEAQNRLDQYGPNEIIDKGAKNPLLILWEQLTDPLVLVLLGAAVVSALLGKVQELIAIMSIVVINAALGVVQEYRAEQAMQALKNMAAPRVRVRRNGRIGEVDSRELVPGDVVLLETGNIIPADGRLVESANLRAQEASLTGESEAVEKRSEPIEDEELTIGDRKNMVYRGTNATYGRGVAVITETGMRTELGRIAQLIQDVDSELTPLQKRMAEVGQVMFYAAVTVALLALVIGVVETVVLLENPLFGDDAAFNEILLNAVAIAVAVVPEGLPAVVTVSLALGTQRMLRRNALIRKLPATETLGSVTVICSDKTGTLTENRMTVKVVDVPGDHYDLSSVMQKPLPKGEHLSLSGQLEGLLLVAGTMANDSTVERIDRDNRDYMVQGDPTEAAIALAAARYGLVKHKMEAVLVRVGEVPFSSERKMMSTIHDVRGDIPMDDALQNDVDKVFKGIKYVVFAKGAPDRIIDLCNRVWENGEVQEMTPPYRERIENANAKLANEGLRVLGVAFRPLDEMPAEEDYPTVEENMVFLGLVGIIDPPRPEVKEAVATCKTAGIRVVMITGDHPITAKAIARDLEIVDANAQALIGKDLEKMTDEELRKVVDDVSVYARVSPEHKLRIVRAMKDNGEIVAMTGDGVNDAPALKQADIGVAMSITGTDVSKEAADMVILDDNFATIVNASEEGRTIYDNVRRFIKYLLASNTGELFVLLITQGIPNIPLPLSTLQILWMNLITDGVPALALGVEQSEENTMNRPPYPPNASVFGGGLGRHILIVGLVLGVTALSLGLIAFNTDLQAANSPCYTGSVWSLGLGDVECPDGEDGIKSWNTMVFIMLTLAQMGHAYGLRSHRQTVFKMDPRGNRFLLYALLITVAIQISTVYLPFFNNLFGTNPLTMGQLVLCLVLSTFVFIAVEIEKLLIRRGVLSDEIKA